MDMREMDGMAREILDVIEKRPMCAIGIGEMNESMFLQVCRRIYQIAHARNARLRARVAEEQALIAKERARIATLDARLLDQALLAGEA